MEYVGNIKHDDYLLENRKFIIYGTGVCGKKIYEYLKENGKENNILFFCDKNLNIDKLFNIDVIFPEDAVNMPDVEFLVAGKYEYEMVGVLLKHNIRKIHLLSL